MCDVRASRRRGRAAAGELEPDSHLLEPVLDNAYMEELLTGKDEGIWALQDDLMLEEPP